MSSARKRSALNKANAEVDRLKSQIHKIKVNVRLLKALKDLVADLEMRSNLKQGKAQGDLDVGHGVYTQAFLAIQQAELQSKEEPCQL